MGKPLKTKIMTKVCIEIETCSQCPYACKKHDDSTILVCDQTNKNMYISALVPFDCPCKLTTDTKGMTVNDLIKRLSAHVQINPNVGDFKLGIPLHIVGVMGGTSIAEITAVAMGFDLDKGIYLIHPGQKLTPLNFF